MLRILVRVALIPTILLIGIVTLSVVSTSVAYAAINSQISFQGKLTNPDGTNVTNGTYSIVFSMYTVASGGSAVWTETQGSVQITDGIFQVNLGSVTSLPGSVDFNSGNIYLGVQVGADPEMTPRILFTASPYAFNSDKLGGLSSGSFVQLAQGVQVDGSTTNASIAINKTGTTAKLMDLQRGGVSVFNINNDGSTLIKNSTDSATEFDIQNSAGVSLMKIDATTDRVYIGNSTADGVGALLVLDSKNTASDPATPVNGGMYYNSSSNRFRCYENSSWQNCLNDQAYSATTINGATAATAAKAAAATILVTPLYIPGQITVNEMRVRVTTALGATGDIGIYDANGNLRLNGGSGTLSAAVGVKTIAPTQTGAARILEPGQYYVALTWNANTGVVAGANIGTAGSINRTGTIAAGGGLVLPATITPSGITNGIYLYGFSINN